MSKIWFTLVHRLIVWVLKTWWRFNPLFFPVSANESVIRFSYEHLVINNIYSPPIRKVSVWSAELFFRRCTLCFIYLSLFFLTDCELCHISYLQLHAHQIETVFLPVSESRPKIHSALIKWISESVNLSVKTDICSLVFSRSAEWVSSMSFVQASSVRAEDFKHFRACSSNVCWAGWGGKHVFC